MILLKRITVAIFVILALSSIFTACGTKSTDTKSSTDKVQATDVKDASKTSVENTSTEDTENVESGKPKAFSKEELVNYDGKINKSSYIAVEGTVYDITNSKDWKNSTYKSYQGGKDYTDVVKDESLIAKLPVVGTYTPPLSESKTFSEND